MDATQTVTVVVYWNGNEEPRWIFEMQHVPREGEVIEFTNGRHFLARGRVTAVEWDVDVTNESAGVVVALLVDEEE